MQPLSNLDSLPVLIFDPDVERAEWLATVLEEQGFAFGVALNAEDALASVREIYFRSVIVAADLCNRDCLAFLDALRRAAPRSWLIAAIPLIDQALEDLAHRHGVDALMQMPLDVDDLSRRLAQLHVRARS